MVWESERGIRHPLQRESDRHRVVIVGTGEQAAVASEYLIHDSPHEVVAFSGEAAFITSDVYRGLPVVPFEQLAETYPPDEYRVFVAVSLTQLSRLRRRLYNAAKDAGYECVSYLSRRAFIAPSATIGENSFIQENTSIQHNVQIGNNVFIGSGSCIGYHAVIKDDVFTGPDVAVCRYAVVGRSVFLGGRCCLSDGVQVGDDCIIGAGAVVLDDTQTAQVCVGNPARPTGRDSYTTWGIAPPAAEAARQPGGSELVASDS